MTKNVVAPGSEILEAALHGLEAERDKLEQRIAQVRALLGRKAAKATRDGLARVPVTRVLSVEARKRIAAAQKKRWAAFRKKQK